MKKWILLLCITVAVGFLSACGSDNGSEPKDLQDGTYKAEYADFDDHGYKSVLEVTIEDGKITAVDYDELDESGARKTEDENYGGGKMSIHPKDAFAQLEDQAVEKQSSDVEAVSGATNSSDSFKKLMDYVLTELAPNGTESGTVEK